MAEHTGGIIRRTIRRAGFWLYSMAFRRGWPRWLFLGAVLAIFLVILTLVRDGVDYRRDPSALVPRSSQFYAETGDLPQMLKKMGEWPVWRERTVSSDQWNQIHVALAEMLSAKVSGLGTRLPLVWLASAERAALAIIAGDNGGAESWAVYLSTADAEKALADIRLETGLTLLRMPGTQTQGLYELTGQGANDNVLFIGVMNPWLIISSDSRLPVFAMDSVRKPAFSLGHSGMLPSLRRSLLVRGLFNPSYFSSRPGTGPLSTLAGWMSPEARWSFAGEMGSSGVVDMRLVGGVMLASAGESGAFWPIIKGVLYILALVCLLLLVGTMSVMIGLGGWYKYLAARAGIAPKKSPVPVEPSQAFREDAGLEPHSSAQAETVRESTDTPPVVQPPESNSTDNPAPQTDTTLDKEGKSELSGSSIN